MYMSQVADEDGNLHETYGVRYEGGLIEDVTFSCCELDELIRRMNEMDLETEHILDVISDFMK
ncbi:MAG: hypothetical protein VB092_04525 [Oscillospiraceae bacterium]|nr:hypothetical protein [Oscillospiraceae bacterium]